MCATYKKVPEKGVNSESCHLPECRYPCVKKIISFTGFTKVNKISGEISS